jgi:hypothetical protein
MPPYSCGFGISAHRARCGCLSEALCGTSESPGDCTRRYFPEDGSGATCDWAKTRSLRGSATGAFANCS